MGLATFIGGVHPFEGKELSQDRPIKLLAPEKGEEMVFPLSQHIGAPAKPLVQTGDRVLKGQIIAEPGGFISANVLSSVSGTVKKIEPRLVANGAMVNSIIVENDGEDEAIEHFGEDRDYTQLSKEEIVQIVKDAGITGLGDAGFPTHVKLAPKNPDAIDYVIVNGAECEPYLTSDYRLMMERPEQIVGGLKVMLALFDNAKGVIGIENNKPDAIAKLKELVKDEPRIEVCELLTKYPQGGERTLIKAVTGREINSGKLPADAGCIVDNTDTVVSIYNAVCKTTPLIRKIITVTGDAITTPQNFEVRLGTNYQRLVDAADGFRRQPEKMLSGGPMMGQALFTIDFPVAKTSSALTTFTKDEVAANAPSACIRCGKCVDVCPEHLVPQMMMTASERQDMEQFQYLNGMECVECGSCAYICPAHRPLTQAFKQMRKAVAAARRKK
ncbi:MAG: electron transport complex subunit RsxC [Clostridium sp.]|nr:electron transport complex subunit RsxC [Clostridium sp.]